MVREIYDYRCFQNLYPLLIFVGDWNVILRNRMFSKRVTSMQAFHELTNFFHSLKWTPIWRKHIRSLAVKSIVMLKTINDSLIVIALIYLLLLTTCFATTINKVWLLLLQCGIQQMIWRAVSLAAAMLQLALTVAFFYVAACNLHRLQYQ